MSDAKSMIEWYEKATGKKLLRYQLEVIEGICRPNPKKRARPINNGLIRGREANIIIIDEFIFVPDPDDKP
jgi:hypothetical protein